MIREAYDVAIIGAGVGGLCAGALLAHAGYKTLVMEKLPRVGGRCSTLDYKGYKLFTGAWVFLYEGTMGKIFKEVGVPLDVKPLPPGKVMHYRIKGVDYPLPEKEGFKALISYASNDEEEYNRVIKAFDRAMRWQEPSDLISMRDWLLQYTNNRTILNIFQAAAVGHHGVNLYELSAKEYFLYLKGPGNIQSPYGFPRHGSGAVMEALAASIEKNGDDVWTRCGAGEIMVSNGMVKGVVAEKKGEKIEIKASVVVSDAGPKATVRLVGEENLDSGYLKEVNEVLRPGNFMCIQYASPVDKPFQDSPRLYYTGTRRLIGTRCFTMVCPELAPEGRHLYASISAPDRSTPPIDWKGELDLTFQDLHDQLPGFDKYVEILTTSCFHGEWPGSRAWSGYEVTQKTPIENLYNVGDGVGPQGWIGTEASAESARIVVADIKERI